MITINVVLKGTFAGTTYQFWNEDNANYAIEKLWDAVSGKNMGPLQFPFDDGVANFSAGSILAFNWSQSDKGWAVMTNVAIYNEEKQEEQRRILEEAREKRKNRVGI